MGTLSHLYHVLTFPFSLCRQSVSLQITCAAQTFKKIVGTRAESICLLPCYTNYRIIIICGCREIKTRVFSLSEFLKSTCCIRVYIYNICIPKIPRVRSTTAEVWSPSYRHHLHKPYLWDIIIYWLDRPWYCIQNSFHLVSDDFSSMRQLYNRIFITVSISTASKSFSPVTGFCFI